MRGNNSPYDLLFTRYMRLIHFLLPAFLCAGCMVRQKVAPFPPSKAGYGEQSVVIDNPANQVLIRINEPIPTEMDHNKKTLLVFYALPNGNSIEWTMGKQMKEGDDWHFDIQHIAAQTRYLRKVMQDHNIITVYLANRLKSWPAWKKQRPDGPLEIKRIVDSVAAMYGTYHPELVLSSHSGGGSFIFGYLDAVTVIPDKVQRIVFIDSDYGYVDSLHAGKLSDWLKNSRQHYLNVLAYNDSVVTYNGKPLVSATGGTWYRSKLMQQNLARDFRFSSHTDTSFIHYSALGRRIDILLKQNPAAKIYHTEQVARNGFIHTILNGTAYQKKAGYQYWGVRAYTAFIGKEE